MLILTRRPNESIKIGNDITVTVMQVSGAQVRIGIDAPREMPVDREEIYLRKRQEGLPHLDTCNLKYGGSECTCGR